MALPQDGLASRWLCDGRKQIGLVEIDNELPRWIFFVTFAHIFMHSSGQQGSGPEGADVSDSSPPPPPPPFENVRDFDL